ncbi:MAG: tRNA threonylcarbamoyladenosine dehydratase [Bacteroidota bacterium]
MDWFCRTELLIGKENLDKLHNSHVMVVGLGGVGAYAAENICRAGVGQITLIDGDKINTSNFNRQLIALNSTLGKNKTDVLKDRLLDINPLVNINTITEYIRDERMIDILSDHFDYVIDAIDTLSPKIFLIYHSLKKNLKIVSSMGSGGKTNPEMIRITDISKSYNCTLARILRKKLHRLGVFSGVKVVFSAEKSPKDVVIIDESEPNKKSIVGTISYMPAVFGCMCASVVIRDLIDK